MLRIHDVAIELVADVMPLLEAIRKADADLARQGRRALMSVPLNIAEASDQAGDRRSLHYRFAMGSAREVWSALIAAHAAKYIPAPSNEIRKKFDRVIGTLHRCVYPRR